MLSSKHNKPIVLDAYYSDNHLPKPIVIFCHGYKGFKDWGAWNIMAATFAKAGFFFLKFNFSHNGGTIEQPIDFPDLEAFGNNNYTKELDDLALVIDWLSNKNLFEKEIALDTISLIGHSRGGGIVLLKAYEDSRIKKVITLASVCDFEKRTATIGNLERWKKEGVKYVLNGRTQQQMPHYFQFYENFMKHKKRLHIQTAVEQLQIPQLIIHGNTDSSVPIEESEKIHKWNPKSTFIVIEDANHVFNTSHPWKKELLSPALEKVVHNCIDFIQL